jgi:flagellin-like hook-associated protein FlgL
MAQAMTQLSQAQVAYQAALQSTALIMSKSLIDYL